MPAFAFRRPSRYFETREVPRSATAEERTGVAVGATALFRDRAAYAEGAVRGGGVVFGAGAFEDMRLAVVGRGFEELIVGPVLGAATTGVEGEV